MVQLVRDTLSKSYGPRDRGMECEKKKSSKSKKEIKYGETRETDIILILIHANEMKRNAGVLGHFFCTIKAELGWGQLQLMR